MCRIWKNCSAGLYEDIILGKLPDERYKILDGQYSKEQKELSAEIVGMEAELSGYEEGRRSAEKFITMVDKYQNFEELTTYMLNEFVEKIVVHERDRKGSIETTNQREKKAEMDAKKEEIRKEDIVKGVFIPVSMLPPAEPKKGAIPA